MFCAVRSEFVVPDTAKSNVASSLMGIDTGLISLGWQKSGNNGGALEGCEARVLLQAFREEFHSLRLEVVARKATYKGSQ